MSVRTPITGISMASAPSISSCNRVVVVKVTPLEILSLVKESYANALISSFEDPENISEPTVLEMNNGLIKLRQATALVLASQKQLENKYKAAQLASEDQYPRVLLALGKGDEDLAREALKRRKAYAMADKRILELEATRDLSRIWLHVDMDAFNAAVDTLCNPSWEGKPVAVGNMSMISSASNEVRLSDDDPFLWPSIP